MSRVSKEPETATQCILCYTTPRWTCLSVRRNRIVYLICVNFWLMAAFNDLSILREHQPAGPFHWKSTSTSIYPSGFIHTNQTSKSKSSPQSSLVLSHESVLFGITKRRKPKKTYLVSPYEGSGVLRTACSTFDYTTFDSRAKYANNPATCALPFQQSDNNDDSTSRKLQHRYNTSFLSLSLDRPVRPF